MVGPVCRCRNRGASEVYVTRKRQKLGSLRTVWNEKAMNKGTGNQSIIYGSETWMLNGFKRRNQEEFSDEMMEMLAKLKALKQDVKQRELHEPSNDRV